jgi:hypothetical protein
MGPVHPPKALYRLLNILPAAVLASQHGSAVNMPKAAVTRYLSHCASACVAYTISGACQTRRQVQRQVLTRLHEEGFMVGRIEQV